MKNTNRVSMRGKIEEVVRSYDGGQYGFLNIKMEGGIPVAISLGGDK